MHITRNIFKIQKKIFLNKDYPLIAIICIFGLSSFPLQIVSGRGAILEHLRAYANPLGSTLAFTYLSRFFNLSVFVLLVIMLCSIYKIKSKNKFYVLIGLFVFYFSNYISGAVFGTFSGITDIYSVVSFLVVIISIFHCRLSKCEILFLGRNLLLVMVFGSVIAAYFFPDWSYVSLSFIGGENVDRRLLGLFNHPRALGVSAIVLLLIELLRPQGRLVFRVFRLFLVVGALFLSMSKTAIILLPIVIALWFLQDRKRRGAYRILRSYFYLALSCSMIFVLIRMFISYYYNHSKAVSTMTGRTHIWEITFHYFSNNPVFGNGPAFFGSTGFTGYANAHNLLVQSLSDGGVIGFLGLLVFLFLLAKVSFRAPSDLRLLSIGLFLILFIFSMSEPIIRFSGMYSGEFFVLLFSLLYLSAGQSTKLLPEEQTSVSLGLTSHIQGVEQAR